MTEPKFKTGEIIDYKIETIHGVETINIKILNFLTNPGRYEYEDPRYNGVIFIALQSQIEANLQKGGRRTRRNKLRKKHRKTNRRR